MPREVSMSWKVNMCQKRQGQIAEDVVSSKNIYRCGAENFESTEVDGIDEPMGDIKIYLPVSVRQRRNHLLMWLVENLVFLYKEHMYGCK